MGAEGLIGDKFATAGLLYAIIAGTLGIVSYVDLNKHTDAHDRTTVFYETSSTFTHDPNYHSHALLKPKPGTAGNTSTLGAKDNGGETYTMTAYHGTTSQVTLPHGQLILSSHGPHQDWVELMPQKGWWTPTAHSGLGAPMFAPKNSFTCLGDLFPGGEGNTSNLTSSIAINYNGTRLFFGTDNERPGDFVVWEYSHATGAYAYHSRVAIDNQTGTKTCASIDVSNDGDRVICGASDDFSGTGSFWIWHWNENTGVWDAEMEATVPTGAGASAAVGHTVVLSGDGRQAFVYAPGYSSNAGAFYLYRRNPATNVWTLGEAVTDINGADDTAVTYLNTSRAGATMSKDGRSVYVTYYVGVNTIMRHFEVNLDTGTTITQTGTYTLAQSVERATVLSVSHDGTRISVTFGENGVLPAIVGTYEKHSASYSESTSDAIRTVGNAVTAPLDFDGNEWATDIKMAHSGRLWCATGDTHANATNLGLWCYYRNEQEDAYRPVQLSQYSASGATAAGNCGNGNVGLSGDGRVAVIGCPLTQQACVSA